MGRIAKSLARRLADLESHTRFLGEALAAYPREPDRYKQIAVQLRLLVVRRGRNHPLLLDLMDELGFEYYVHPIPDLPFPIPMVAGVGEEPELDLSSLSLEEILEYQESRKKSIPLRQFIDEALAVYVEGHALSHGDLIAEVAQQMGSAHEDPSIDPHLVTLERIEIGGIASHGRTLMETGQLVYGAALGLIGHAVEQLSFIPQYHEVRRSEPVQGEDATTATASDKRPRPS